MTAPYRPSHTTRSDDNSATNTSGIVEAMATSTVSYTLPDDLPAEVKAAAERAGLSTSAYVARALRGAVVRDGGRQYADWLAHDQEAADEIGAFMRAGATLGQLGAAS
jgi:hypothetical protein